MTAVDAGSDHCSRETPSGSEFRDDVRLPSTAREQTTLGTAGSANANARRALSAQELAPLTQLSWWRSLWPLALTVGSLVLGISLGLIALQQILQAPSADAWWSWPMLIIAILWIGIHQHAWFILNHDAAHYRLVPHRGLNDALGSFIGMTGGVSMHTYRVTHRLHHNHLYGPQDPDTAIHGGYPRGKAYLVKKLALDLLGINAWKTYAYFFGSPAINDDIGGRVNPLNDTSPQLRQAARRDRLRVVAFHVCMPVALILIAFYAESMGLGSQYWLGIWAYILLWLVPLVTVLQPILRLRAICEHGAVSDLSSPLTAARCNRTWGSWGNWLGRFLLFPHHVNHHLEHHLYPAVPHYHLRRLHDLLQAKGALQGAEVRDVADTMAAIFAPRKPKMQAKSAPIP